MLEPGNPQPAGMGGVPPPQLNGTMHQVNVNLPLRPAAPLPPPPGQAPANAPQPQSANNKQTLPPEKAEPWKYLPRDKCPYREDGKCIGPELCLYKMDTWGQQRAIAKFKFSERYGSPKSPKEAHVFYLGRKLSQLEEEDDKKFDLWIKKSRECAFHKTLDFWDASSYDEGEEPSSWSRLV